jgi:hypothetical protein
VKSRRSRTTSNSLGFCNATSQVAQPNKLFFFRFGEFEDDNAAFRYRFVFDLDGNSFSGRFYGFLASHSVVLKQTLFREWHDERLFPWVHYVPISLGLGELPEVMRYLVLTDSGAKTAKEIAEGGRTWKLRALRMVDMGFICTGLCLSMLG